MFRSRLFRALSLLVGMAAVIYVIISLFLPSSRRLIFGVDKHSGKVRLVTNHVTFLPPHQFYRLSFDKRDGAAQRDDLVRIYSKEHVPVTISYRLRFSIPGEKIPDARTLVRDGWSAWIRMRVGEAVSAVTQQVPIEELVSPTSQFATRRDVLRRVVAGHLARSGLQVTAFEIARIEPDRRALLDAKRAELRRGARGVAGRVAVFAIDGADWELLSELSDDGRIPNIQALARGGVTGTTQTIQPTVSPLVWTTVATGLTPDRHGVIDFMDAARKRPVDATTRRAPAVWDIVEAFGRRAEVVNWWTDWPPLPDSAVTYDAPVELLRSAVYPRELLPRVGQLDVTPDSIQYAQVARFLNITGAEYQQAVASGNPNDPINVFRNVLAKTWTDHRVAINLYQQQEPLLLMMSYEGTDVVNHLFAPYHPPYREDINETNYRRYWPTVANYYSEVDRLIGEWMKVLSDDTTVIIVSAHGFRWGKNRPRVQPIGRSALSDHRNPGIFIAYGNHVAPSRGSHSLSIYDVVPTVLSILGLPKSAEMPGNAVTWAFRDITPVTSVGVVSYNEFFNTRPVAGLPISDPNVYTHTLQAVGHLSDASRMQPVFEDQDETQTAANKPIPPQQWAAYAYYNNLGIELRKQGKFKDAVDAFQKAIDLNPSRPAPYLNMAMTLFDRQQYTAADEVFVQAVAHGLPNADRWFVDFAALYRSRDMNSRAIALLYKGKQIFPQSYDVAANLGSALAQASRYTEGLPELERALGLQPSSTLVLNNLGIFYAKKKDFARALDFWNRSLTIDPRQPSIRSAVSAARTQL
ncbi:MAG: alkaline phosphatase family protein [Acidobacteria bacterium]|nr:alkaline phosphatase family protein [Acidobacteriota bacterium]MBV9475883.1 alkaline phosphatase family protein [Acidobacteriota bacterium]